MAMDAKKRLRVYTSLKTDRSTWDSRWQSVKEWIQPEQAHITETTEPTPSLAYRSKIHDSKAIKSAQTLTHAHMSYITPLNEDWLGYSLPRTLKAKLKEAGTLDEAEGYFKKCSEVAMEAIASSNFYTAIHSLYKDRSIPGTGAMILKSGKKGGLNFQYVPIGTFCFTEDENGLADSFYREYELTLDQAVEEFGKENLGAKLSANLAASAAKPELLQVKSKFLHVITEREDYDPKKDDALNMPYADENICMTDSKMLTEGGFQEFPVMVSRYERWGNNIWGFSPAYNALPNILSANYIRKLLKTLGEISAFPRILKLAGEKRQIDLRAGGQSVISEQSARLNFPKEFGTGGRFDVGMALLEQDHEAIDQFFHVPLFEMFASIDKQMTATEVAAREREKLLMFAPSFTQFVTDMTPMMLRVFAMLARAKALPAPPTSLAEDNGDDTGVIPTPEVVFLSRIALAIKGLQGEGFDRVLMRLSQVVQFAPEVLDNFDFDQTFRDLARNDGVPERWLKLKKAVDDMREARAKAQQKDEQMQQAEQAAGAVGKAGGAEGVEQLADMMEGGQ